MKILKNGKKKKGFTLIELIIVIAIIGILALIIIPQVLGYTNKAKNGTDVADARTLMSAVQAYNAENPTAQIDTSSNSTKKVSDLTTYNDATINDAVTKINAADTSLYGANLSDLQNIINGSKTLH